MRWLLGIGAVVAWAPVVSAQVAECIPARDQNDPDGDGVTFEHITSFGRREIRVSTVNLGALGVSETSVIRAVGLATSIWNEQSGGRPMRYTGNTSITSLPSSLSQCEQNGTTDSLVVVDPGSDPGGGTNTAKIAMRCIDPFSPTMGLGWAFQLTLYAKDLAGNTNSWVTAARTLSAGQSDLVSTLVHELGHAFNITHHSRVDAGLSETQFSVMGYGDSSTRRRDLYWRDIQCATTLSRSSSVFRRAHTNGVLGAEALFYQGSIDEGWGKVSAGVTFSSQNASVDWSHAGEGFGCTQWGRGVPPSNERCMPDSNDLHVFTEAVWRERSPTFSRVLWTDPNEYLGTTLSNGSRDAVHRVRVRRSSDGFTTGTTNFLAECSAMTGFMTCTNTTPVASAQALATAWHEGLSRSVTAWVHMNRLNNESSHAVRIAVGSAGESTLPVADVLTDPPGGTPVQSSVGPGLACRNNLANGFDCIIALVRQDDALGRVRVYRFSVAQDNARNRFAITVDPVSTLLPNDRSGSRIAAWHHNGQFYVAFRSLNNLQRLQVRSSADTLTWTGSGPNTDIDAGPSAVSYFTGNNQLMYVR